MPRWATSVRPSTPSTVQEPLTDAERGDLLSDLLAFHGTRLELWTDAGVHKGRLVALATGTVLYERHGAHRDEALRALHAAYRRDLPDGCPAEWQAATFVPATNGRDAQGGGR